MHPRYPTKSRAPTSACAHTLLGGRVLRSGDRPGVEQEIWALLVLYQLLRTAIADAAGTVPGTDPDRASFTIALNAARDQVTAPQGVFPGGPPTWPATSAAPSWPPAARPPAPLQRPQGQVRHLALPQPRRRPPAHRHHHHRNQRHYLQPPPPGPTSKRRPTARPAGSALSCRPAASSSPPSSPASRHATRAATNSPCCGSQAPHHAHPAPRMGPASASSPAPASAPTH